jgi:hypothetical protein
MANILNWQKVRNCMKLSIKTQQFIVKPLELTAIPQIAGLQSV